MKLQQGLEVAIVGFRARDHARIAFARLVRGFSDVGKAWVVMGFFFGDMWWQKLVVHDVPANQMLWGGYVLVGLQGGYWLG
jgi:hypothetical protein